MNDSSQFFPDTCVRDRLLADVRSKKDLMFLSTDFILYHVNEQLRLNKKLREFVHSTEISKLVKSKKYEEIVKYVRAKARNAYAIFQIPSLVAKRKELLESVKISDKSDGDKIVELLHSHLSTKERVENYGAFFDLVIENCGKPKSVLDLACGLNPVAYYHYADFTNSKKTQYLCNELSDLDCQQLNSFFANNKLPASAVSFDLVREFEILTQPPFNQKFDICFLLKALDTLESQKLYVTYDIIKRVDAKFFVATFPNQSMSGKQMKRSAQINWFEKMLPRLGLSFTRHELGNEVVYICKKL